MKNPGIRLFAGIVIILASSASAHAQKLPGLIPFRDKQGLFGYCDSMKKIIIPCRFDRAELFDGDSALVEWENKQGHIFKNGKMGKVDSNFVPPPPPAWPFTWIPMTVMFPTYVVETESSPKLIPVRAKSGLYGYMNRKSDTAIACRYKTADYYAEGLAFVTEGDSVSGFIDEQGKWALRFSQAEVSSASAFKHGLAEFASSRGRGIMTKKGTWIIPPIFDLAPVVIGPDCILAGNSDARFFCNGKGIPVEPKFYSEVSSLSSGRILVQDAQSRLYGYTDAKGKLVIPCIYAEAVGFSMNAAPACMSGMGWGLIDLQGRKILPFEYNQVFFAGQEYSLFVIQRDERYGYFNARTKKMDIPLTWQDASVFDERGWASVMDTSTNSYGMINRSGEKQIDFLYDEQIIFSGDSLAIISRENRFGLINRAGKEVVKPEYSELNSFNSFGLAWAQNWDGYYGCINNKGDTIIAFKFNTIYNFDEAGMAKVETGDGAYYIDRKGNEYFEPVEE
ncbi:MAG: hypothetical protein FD123_3316 [Bacteroidetes bacterium]|nr:MAG: hypothetical protein FD123_3316 [Bacteroidota bacterium]